MLPSPSPLVPQSCSPVQLEPLLLLVQVALLLMLLRLLPLQRALPRAPEPESPVLLGHEGGCSLVELLLYGPTESL